MLNPDDESRALAEIHGRLQSLFPEVEPHLVDEVMQSSHRLFDGNPIRDFVPVLVERLARADLRRLATTSTRTRS